MFLAFLLVGCLCLIVSKAQRMCMCGSLRRHVGAHLEDTSLAVEAVEAVDAVFDHNSIFEKSETNPEIDLSPPLPPHSKRARLDQYILKLTRRTTATKAKALTMRPTTAMRPTTRDLSSVCIDRLDLAPVP